MNADQNCNVLGIILTEIAAYGIRNKKAFP